MDSRMITAHCHDGVKLIHPAKRAKGDGMGFDVLPLLVPVARETQPVSEAQPATLAEEDAHILKLAELYQPYD
jgi:hypothetical protein